MSSATDAFARSWAAFQEAFEAGDDAGAHQALRDWIEAWDRCVREDSLEVFELAYHDDLRARSHLRLPGVPEANGIESFRRHLREIPDVASRFRFDVTGFHREGERFVGSGTFRARGRYSGLVLRFPLAVLWSYRDGRIATVDAYGGRRSALAALRESAGVEAPVG